MIKLPTPIFAQATGTGQLQQGLGIALGIIMAIAFIYGVIQIMGGVRQVRNGEAEGKMGIVAGILIAGAVAIMVALYAAFGLSSSVVTPQGF
jgi:amino acid transporter